MKRTLSILSALTTLAGAADAQLSPPFVPANNPITTEKVLLGKALFWDEQMSSTRTVSCGTCHMPEAGGGDPRTLSDPEGSRNPGFDGLLGTDDDVFGSQGVPLADAAGDYQRDALFGFHAQTTGRKAPSAIGAAYSRHLFWDGRAERTYNDPQTGLPLASPLEALESQVLGPPASSVEMGHVGRDWNDVVDRVRTSQPLALSEVVPPSLASWIAGRDYPELFQLAFGTNEVTAERIAKAIATYERTLIPDHTPWDRVLAGMPVNEVLTDEERTGIMVFLDPAMGNCFACHGAPPTTMHFSDDRFHYIGVRPPGEDLGRFNVTGNNEDRGAFRTPRLRNVELRAPYMHNGSLATLEDVVEFYNRGGLFDAPNKNPAIQQLDLESWTKDALVAFMSRPLTDPRVAAALPPFDRPSQYADSDLEPQVFGVGTPGSGGIVPEIIAIEPPKIGNTSLTLALDRGLGGAPAFLLASPMDTPGGLLRFGSLIYPSLTGSTLLSIPALSGQGPGDGWTSVVLTAPNDTAFIGSSLFLQWFVLDPGAAVRFSASRAVEMTWF